MKFYRKICLCSFASCISCLLYLSVVAQKDTSSSHKDTLITKTSEETILQRKDFLGKMMKNLRRDTTAVDRANQLTRNEEAFNKYEGMIIRNIDVKRFPFGTVIGDTSKRLNNGLTEMANYLHHQTRVRIIRNNLFFSKGQALNPYLMADNVTFLRQLSYLHDAEIKVIPVAPGSDSVDILVEAKDVFSLGGTINTLGIEQSNVQFKEDNFAGTGNSATIYSLYDTKRLHDFAFGGEYNSRNIGGSFINGTIGYQSSYPTFAGAKDENRYYVTFSKPLINRYMKWVYELDGAYHSTRNMYNIDSVYHAAVRYRYYNVEGWIGYNINTRDFTLQQESKKLRKLISIRFINQKFQELPDIYKNNYYWQYADLSGVLTTLTFYRQNFYKTQYIYGFGRNEDIPEGLLLSLTSGFTIKENRRRPFIGFNYQRYQFNDKKNYISFILRGEGYLNHKTFEDINFLGSLGYFDHLKAVGSRWKQRFFLNFDIAEQMNTVLNEPLYPNSKFGWPEYGNRNLGGNFRATIKAESEFFSPWSFVGFRVAPFMFGNVGAFSPYNAQTRILSSIGAGIRTRNESLIFGTIEMKGYYFPQKNFYNDSFGVSFTTNLTFTSNTQFVTKPDFIKIN
ncbi:MAG: hypothetical protein ABI184_06990 [Ginsengibacter sp.]